LVTRGKNGWGGYTKGGTLKKPSIVHRLSVNVGNMEAGGGRVHVSGKGL